MELSNRKSRFLTPEQRAAVYGAYMIGKVTYQEIANQFQDLNLTRAGAQKIVMHYKKTGNFNDDPRIGRPNKCSFDNEKILERVLKAPQGTIKQAKIEIEKTGTSCERTLSNHAHKLGIFYLPKEIEKGELLNPIQLQKRIEHCKLLKEMRILRDKFIFADESAFPLQ